jgi:threonylcarbamoyladenosine tRNA methylthiotransferase MtaB
MSGTRVITFGCRLNAFESEVMRGHAEAAGLNNAVLINTCAVTAEATRQARQAIRRARRDEPDAKIVVAGCAAQLEPDTYAAMPEVDLVLGNADKLEARSYRSHGPEKVRVNNIMAVRETAGHMIDGLDGRTRAFVRIQNGCDHRCTFCIIPYARGNSRSVPVAEAVRQIRLLVEQGYREVVLTGVDITSYGGDLPGAPSLGELCRALLDGVPDLPRLRLSSIDPAEIDETLMEVITTEPRCMPHLHLSLQAGDDMVLKRMKRRHLRDDAIRFCEDVRAARPDVAFGADLIAGFPTETDAMFENTLALVEDCGLTFLHVFPYSSRSGTPAARMPQVPMELRKERAARLRQAGRAALSAFLDSHIGGTGEILVEKTDDDGGSIGHSRHYAPIRIDGAFEPGAIVTARIRSVEDGRLIGAAA